jgi:hypothetical protein
MPDPHSWNRRESSVVPAGMFNVLRSNGWFSTLRLPAGFRYRIKGAAPENPAMSSMVPPAPGAISPQRLEARDPWFSKPAETPLQLEQIGPEKFRPVRMLLIILAAIAAMMGMLYWIGNP